jgi:hypothetical protein
VRVSYVFYIDRFDPVSLAAYRSNDDDDNNAGEGAQTGVCVRAVALCETMTRARARVRYAGTPLPLSPLDVVVQVALFYGASVVDALDDDVTHVIVDIGDLSRIPQVSGACVRCWC